MAVVDSTATVPATLLTRYYLGGRYEIDSTSTTTTERFYLGGDAYSAPMVLVRTGGSGSWTAYNIGRDYLGSITHIVTASGTSVAEYSYDPWGRMRNPTNLTIYNVGSESSLFLGRGYTGHEFLPWFGLYNMNARLYDPLVGRFLSPDPYVQAPDFTQNFNRYSYCLNNPLKYNDESGELFGIDDLIAGAIGGLINWGTNGFKFTWEGLSYFGIGFAGGVASLYISPILSSGLVAAANSAIGQGFGDNGQWNGSNINWGAVAFSGIVGGATSYVGGVLSNQVSGLLSKITGNIPGKAWAGMINQGLTGFTTGFALGTGMSAINQYANGQRVDWGFAAGTGLRSGLTGLALGGISGMAKGILDARHNEENPWAFNDNQLTSDTIITANDLGLQGEVERITQGKLYSYNHDGKPFYNKEGLLPNNTTYTEYIVPPISGEGAGTQRIYVGLNGSWYYSPDHHYTAILFKP